MKAARRSQSSAPGAGATSAPKGAPWRGDVAVLRFDHCPCPLECRQGEGKGPACRSVRWPWPGPRRVRPALPGTCPPGWLPWKILAPRHCVPQRQAGIVAPCRRRLFRGAPELTGCVGQLHVKGRRSGLGACPRPRAAARRPASTRWSISPATLYLGHGVGWPSSSATRIPRRSPQRSREESANALRRSESATRAPPSPASYAGRRFASAPKDDYLTTRTDAKILAIRVSPGLPSGQLVDYRLYLTGLPARLRHSASRAAVRRHIGQSLASAASSP